MGLLAAVQVEMNAIILERRVMTTLTRNIPTGADKLREDVLVCSAKAKKWNYFLVIVDTTGRMLTSQSLKGKPQPLNAF